MLEPLFALHCLEELIPLNYHFAIDQGTLQLKLKLWPYLLRITLGYDDVHRMELELGAPQPAHFPFLLAIASNRCLGRIDHTG